MTTTVTHDASPALVQWGPLRLDIEPVVYSTVVLLTVTTVALDDGVGSFGDAVLIVTGTPLATALGHLFASMLAALHRPGTRSWAHQFLTSAAHAAQHLVMAVLALLVVVLGMLGVLGTPDATVTWVLRLGLLFFVGVGAVGGWRARESWWAAVMGAVGAGVIGFAVLILRRLLEGH